MKVFSKGGCWRWLDRWWRVALAAWKCPRESPSSSDQKQNIKIISGEECWQWLESNLGSGFARECLDEQYKQCASWALTELLARRQTEFAGCAVYKIPDTTRKRTVLAKVVSKSLVDASQPALFWITRWGTGPSIENMTLFDGYRKSLGESRPLGSPYSQKLVEPSGYRKSLGESRPLGSAPGHIFRQAHLPQLECLLGLTLYFHWDASLFTASGAVILRLSTAERVTIFAKNITDLKRFETEFERLGFSRQEGEHFSTGGEGRRWGAPNLN
jgi:hypothetical protein